MRGGEGGTTLERGGGVPVLLKLLQTSSEAETSVAGEPRVFRRPMPHSPCNGGGSVASLPMQLIYLSMHHCQVQAW